MTNVVMIALDDLFNVTKYRSAFGVEIQTPNLDRLASMGTTFENAQASIAVCNPSRTSIMSGQSPFQTGVHLQGPEQWSDVMAPEDTLVGMMKAAGFETFGSGKTYHDQTQVSAFEKFDVLYDHHFQSLAAQTVAPGHVATPQPVGSSIKDDENVAWAVNQIEANPGDDPFFLTVGIIRPHRPFVVPQEYFDLYPQSQITLPTETEVAADLSDVSPFYKDFRLLDNYDTNLQNNGLDKEFAQGYLASVTYADAQVGLLLDAIEGNASISSDTSIVLWSDHGYHLGSRDTWNKFTLWEEASNAPLIVATPGVAGGTVIKAPVSLLDVFPTVLELGGVAPPAGRSLDGRSLIPVVNDPAHVDWTDSSAITSMVGSLSLRTEQFRLVVYNDGSFELYELLADPGQITNLAALPGNQATIDLLTARLVAEVAAQGGMFDPSLGTLAGTAQGDSFFVTGLQTAIGGDGDDLYFVSDGAMVVEASGEGYDTVVFADFDFTIPDNVEYVRNSVYSNNIPFVVSGNAQDNEVYIYQVRGNVSGGDGDDTINTFRSRDTVDGGNGDDFIRTLSGTKNTLIGGSGRDTVLGGDRTDDISGDVEDDILVGDLVLETEGGAFVAGRHLVIDGASTILSISGSIDLLPYFPAASSIGGLPDFDAIGGDDTIDAGAGNDIVLGQGGDHLIDGGSGDDTLFGNGGVDQLWGRSGDDIIIGASGNDSIWGHSGADSINGGIGDDQLSAGTGNDTIFGAQGNDLIRGEGGDDQINAGTGADTIYGGTGADTIEAASCDDILAGQGGNDQLFGGLGADSLSGGGGEDELYGQGGNDTLNGDTGNDLLSGGSGTDLFVFQSGWGHDTITDFSTTAPEQIDLSGISSATGLSALSVVQNGSDVMIALDGNSLILQGVALSSLDSTDFIWV